MKKIYTSIFLFFLLIAFTAFSPPFSGEDPLHVYPNPAEDQVTIELETDLSATPDVKIFDLTGKVVLEPDDKQPIENSQYKLSLDISSLRAGIYFIKITQEEQVYSQKLMIK